MAEDLMFPQVKLPQELATEVVGIINDYDVQLIKAIKANDVDAVVAARQALFSGIVTVYEKLEFSYMWYGRGEGRLEFPGLDAAVVIGEEEE